MLDVPSFACGAWVAPGPNARPLESAITDCVADVGLTTRLPNLSNLPDVEYRIC